MPVHGAIQYPVRDGRVFHESRPNRGLVGALYIYIYLFIFRDGGGGGWKAGLGGGGGGGSRHVVIPFLSNTIEAAIKNELIYGDPFLALGLRVTFPDPPTQVEVESPGEVADLLSAATSSLMVLYVHSTATSLLAPIDWRL